MSLPKKASHRLLEEVGHAPQAAAWRGRGNCALPSTKKDPKMDIAVQCTYVDVAGVELQATVASEAVEAKSRKSASL